MGTTIDPALLANLNAGVAAAGGDIPNLGVTGNLNGANPFAEYFPTYAGGTDTTGASSGDLAKALQALSKGATPQQTGGGAPAGAPSPGNVPSGRPGSPVNLNALIQLLQKRQQGLFDSATAGVGQAQPQAAPRVMGLLGY
jgi:hypothetical protein